MLANKTQEQTDRENWEHCKRIAEELEAYAAGNVYRCPECGEVVTIDPDDERPMCFCGEPLKEEDALNLWDYFEDALDIEYRVNAQKEYKSVSVMVAFGGPNIYIDTASGYVELYWWTDTAKYRMLSDVVEEIDEYFEELYNC